VATLTLTLLSGAVENETADFALRLAQSALDQGHRINLFLLGNASYLANQEVPFQGDKGLTPELAAYMDSFRLTGRIEDLAKAGAVIHTCHTTEYARGVEGCPYLAGVSRGNVGVSWTKFLMTSDLALTLG